MYEVKIIVKNENSGKYWVFDKYGIHVDGEDVYYDVIEEHAFQLENGKKISALSYGAFGENAHTAIESYKAFLREGRYVWDNIIKKRTDIYFRYID